MNHTSYVEKVLSKFSMHESKYVTLTVASHFKLSKDQHPIDEFDIRYMNKVPYANAIGLVIYPKVCTRSDIAHAISTLSKFMANIGLNTRLPWSSCWGV